MSRIAIVRSIQTFEVSLKAFIVRDDRVLFVREADTGWWELPGGRIDVGEEWSPHDAVLRRELAEELGQDLQVEISAMAVTWVRQRPTDGVFQCIVGRACRYLAGVPVLSAEHAESVWLAPAAWRKLDFPPQSHYAAALDRLAACALEDPPQ